MRRPRRRTVVLLRRVTGNTTSSARGFGRVAGFGLSTWGGRRRSGCRCFCKCDTRIYIWIEFLLFVFRARPLSPCRVPSWLVFPPARLNERCFGKVLRYNTPPPPGAIYNFHGLWIYAADARNYAWMGGLIQQMHGIMHGWMDGPTQQMHGIMDLCVAETRNTFTRGSLLKG